MTAASDHCDKPARRLGRIAGLCISGQEAAAELELCEWLREPDTPAAARVMLAALLARRGDVVQASGCLHESSCDPLELLSLLCLWSRDPQQEAATRRVAARLHHEFAHLPLVEHWLNLTTPPGAEARDEPPDRAVEQLADELTRQPAAIRTLVVAQQYRPRAPDVELLRRAIARLAPRFAHERRLVMICQALAELAMLAGDNDDARRWAHRGLKVDPYAAPLALVLAQIADDEAVGPPAVTVLDRVAQRHPTYADVQAALIRRRGAAA